MKDRIIERLLNEGHITIQMADIIINNKTNKAEIIADLKHDSIITNWEAIILLKENESGSIPFGTPNQTFPVMPLTYPPNYHDWTWDPNRTGSPMWDVTCTSNINKNHSEK